MISAELINLLRRRVPNYHVLSPKFVKGGFSVCPCAACKHVIKGERYGGVRKYTCSLVMDDCQKMGCIGNSLVSRYGTCDAANFVPEKWEVFKLEGELIDLPTRPPAKAGIVMTGGLPPVGMASQDGVVREPVTFEQGEELAKIAEKVEAEHDREGGQP